MMSFFVKKIEWDRGEEFGDVFTPRTFSEFQAKIQELDAWGKENVYPFLVIIHFDDPAFRLDFTVGHSYSFVVFEFDADRENKMPYRHSYLVNPQGDVNEIVPIYCWTHYTEPDTTRMLPQEQVLEAVYYFVTHKMFPSFIEFDEEEVNAKYVVGRTTIDSGK